MALSLHRLDPRMAIWNLITIGNTHEDGRCPGLITSDAFTPGMYKIRFETGQYWESLGQSGFYPYVEIVFTISDADQSFHVPLLVSRYSYSTYRGSYRTGGDSASQTDVIQLCACAVRSEQYHGVNLHVTLARLTTQSRVTGHQSAQREFDSCSAFWL
ncbi:hypothetical protein QQF64_023252 [Cirrhinus molitorella]|uniref:5-hydroxyisourate hydrolase n=1 Tax=Cirrhinus molitorella TaxID=172907 RepID=A0ABR3L708_9TELE